MLDMEISLPPCPACVSTNTRLFGHQSGKQRYRCRDCHKTWRDDPAPRETDPRRKAQILAAYHERMSLRGLARTFGVSRSTVSKWLKKSDPSATIAADPGCRPGGGRS